MTSTQWILIAVVFIPLAFVVAGRLRVDVAALLMAVTLGVLQLLGFGMLGPENTPWAAQLIISGFSQPIIIILISLFILTRTLEKSGMTHWIARSLLRRAGANQSLFVFLFATTTAVLSLFMNNLAAGALVLPIAMEVARRTRVNPSKLLIPVAYGSLLGGTATYFTTANIIMSDLLPIAHPPQQPLNILDFTPTGGLIAIAGVLYLGLLGSRLLPERSPSGEHSQAYHTGSELEDFYQLSERLWEARLLAGSPLTGKTLAQTEIGKNWGVTVAAIRRNKEDYLFPSPGQAVEREDVLLLI